MRSMFRRLPTYALALLYLLIVLTTLGVVAVAAFMPDGSTKDVYGWKLIVDRTGARTWRSGMPAPWRVDYDANTESTYHGWVIFGNHPPLREGKASRIRVALEEGRLAIDVRRYRSGLPVEFGLAGRDGLQVPAITWADLGPVSVARVEYYIPVSSIATHYMLRTPAWLFVAVVMVPAVLYGARGLSRYWRLVYRRRHGLCRTCGYNLRGSISGRCPECGSDCRHAVRPATAGTTPS